MVKVKNKGKKRQGPKSSRLRTKEILKKKDLNPFEVHVNRQKHDVLGRKVKHDIGLPGVARAKAMKKRKATLLQEYRVQDKSNKFLDRRIGEKNSAMTGEDRVMARFTAERMKVHNKKAMFNLADDEVLTHHGQTLNEIEKFDDPRSDDEDEIDQGKLESSFVKDAHFGGGMFTKSSNPQSRKDLIDQMIADSKKRKAEQKKFREEMQELTQKLDTDWKDLLPLISKLKKKPGADAAVVEKPDEYDVLIRELRFEARGKPTDRLKTEEEIALEEKERLEKLESDRLRRMRGITDSDKPTITHRSADDLDDGFEMETLEDPSVVSYGPDGKLELASEFQEKEDVEEETGDEDEKSDSDSANESSSEDDDKSDDTNDDENDDLEDLKSDSESDETSSTKKKRKSKPTPQMLPDAVENKEQSSANSLFQSFGEEPGNDSEDEGALGKMSTEPAEKKVNRVAKEVTNTDVAMETESTREQQIKEDLKARRVMMDKARKELPYTFKVPESYEELQELLTDQSPEYQSVIMERIIKCTHPSLADGNKEKLATLLAFLLQHLHDKASQENDSECFVVLDRLAPHLYDIAIIAPGNARRCVAEVLKEKQADFQSQRHEFPGQDTLVFLKLVSLLFPTSDYRHPVVTPAFVFMGQMLTRCRVRTRRDVAAGLYITTLILEYTFLSKRFCPAAINFLLSLLRLAMPDKKSTSHLLQISSDFSPSANLGITSLKELSSVLKIDNNFRYQAVCHAVRLLGEFCTNLSDLPAAFQIFQPVLQLTPKHLPRTLCKQVKELQSTVKTMGSKNMPNLIPEAKKPKLLRLYEPSFDKVYDGKKFRVMSRERQDREKLIHKVKRETKGAMREIRRDRTFIAKLKIKETLQSDAERRAKVRDIFGSAATQQGELRALERKKKK